MNVSNPNVAVSQQYMNRPADQRHASLHALGAFCRHRKDISREVNLSTRDMEWMPDTLDPTMRGLTVVGKGGKVTTPTHWSFTQACQLVGAPAGYLRTLPAPMVADCLNYGFKFGEVRDVKAYLHINGERTLSALTSPTYGRVYNADFADALVQCFGDGVTGEWSVPGTFRQSRGDTIDASNSTIFAGDRDMFVFLSDQEQRIRIKGRRHGKDGEASRGFYCWNSEVGSGTMGVAEFWFDYMCSNRMLWGVSNIGMLKVRHTISAPHRFVEEIVPMLKAMHDTSLAPMERTIAAAQEAKLDNVTDWLKAKRFTTAEITGAATAFLREEGRPLVDRKDQSTIWDTVTGLTAYAKGIQWQDDRVDLERRSSKLLELVRVR